MIKELLQKDHVDEFSRTLKYPQRKVWDILLHTLEYFGQTHTSEDIDDLNRLLAWTLYSRRPLMLAELNAVTGLESVQGEFLDIRDKIMRDFSAYFTIIDVSQKTKDHMMREEVRSGHANLLPAHSESNDGDSATPQIPTDRDESSVDAEKATVKLSHSSITRFFRHSDKIYIKEKNAFIGASRVDAHLHLTKTCLKLICSTTLYENAQLNTDSRTLVDYAAKNFRAHLEELDWKNLPKEEKAEIAQYLVRMFREDSILDRWLIFVVKNFWPDWFTTAGPISFFWNILTDEDAKLGLAEEDQAWINNPKSPTAEKLLKGIAMFMAKQWLQGNSTSNGNWFPLGCYMYVGALIKLVCTTEC